MKTISSMMIAALIALLSGCSTVQYKPIAANESFWQDRKPVIGIVADKMPQADAEMWGNQGLLDIAINRGVAATMITQLQTLNLDRAATIHKNMADALERRGFKVVRFDPIDSETVPEFKIEKDPEQYSWKDYRSYASKGIDQLLVVRVVKVGTTRTYYGFIPTGPPRATFAATGKLIDLKTNKLIWYDSVQPTAVVPEPWDQEPNFPNVSAAVMKNMAEGSAALERSMFATRVSAPTAATAPAAAATPPTTAAK